MTGLIRPGLGVVLVGVSLVACRVERREPSPSGTAKAPPMAAPIAFFRVPADTEIPDDPHGASIRRGRAILNATRDSLPGFVGNGLRCTTCHLDSGTRPFAAPWVGVWARFPQYRSRNARVNLLEDRVNDCIQRSLAGTPLPFDSDAMRDIIAYMRFLSVGVPVGSDVPGQGFRRFGPLETDTARGRAVFTARCTRCHGQRGEGSELATPLWGPRAYTIGAGMARVYTAAAFIRENMPFDTPGILSEQEAFDVAAFVNAQARPDFIGKEGDWPLGNAPPDAAYPTSAGSQSRKDQRRTP